MAASDTEFDDDGFTALARAAFWGNCAEAVSLLAAGHSPNAADRRGFVALHCAAQTNNLRMAAALLSAKASPDIALPNKDEHYPPTPIAIAAFRGRSEMVRLLIEGGAAADPAAIHGAKTLLGWAEMGRDGIAIDRIASLADTRRDGVDPDCPVLDAVRFGTSADVAAAIGSGVAFDPGEAMSFAAARGRIPVIRALLNAGCSASAVDGRGTPALWWSALFRKPAAAEFLVASGARADFIEDNDEFPTALHLAACFGMDHLAEMLLAADCELFAINSEGKLAVEIATGPIRRMIAAAMEAKRPGTAAKHGLA